MFSQYTAGQIDLLKERKERIEEWPRIEGRPVAANLIEKGEGSFSGCLGNLKMLHGELADYSWFALHDLTAFKYHSFITAKLMYIRAKHLDEEGVMSESECYYALMSDSELAFNWIKHQLPHSDLFRGRMINAARDEYRHYQLNLALNANWSDLAERSKFFLNSPPAKMKKYVPDMKFYLALAEGDCTGMTSALTELCSPAFAKIRNDVFELFVPGNFVSPFACIYAKIASRHGHSLQIDSTLIPAEWIPILPLENYTSPYGFMSDWDMTN